MGFSILNFPIFNIIFNEGFMSIRTTDEIWEAFSQGLKGFIANRISNSDNAEDILQDVFLKIHNHIQDLKQGDRLESWIYQITRNAVTDYYRRKHRVADSNVEVLTESGFTGGSESPQSDGILECLKPMVLQMSEKYREAILLTEYDSLPQNVLAERLGISLSGAKTRVQRGRKILKDMLLRCCHFEFDRLGNILDYQVKDEGCGFCSADPDRTSTINSIPE